MPTSPPSAAATSSHCNHNNCIQKDANKWSGRIQWLVRDRVPAEKKRGRACLAALQLIGQLITSENFQSKKVRSKSKSPSLHAHFCALYPEPTRSPYPSKIFPQDMGIHSVELQFCLDSNPFPTLEAATAQHASTRTRLKAPKQEQLRDLAHHLDWYGKHFLKRLNH
eukprot:1156224-Pelagomonas_calceolata.AAC.3